MLTGKKNQKKKPKKPYSNRNPGPNCIFCHPPTFARTFQRSFWRSSVIRVRCLVSLRSMWCSFFLFLTVFPQPFTGQKDTPSPHSIEWDGIKHLWEEKEPSQASCVLILIDTVYNYTMLVDSWIIICCITNKQPGYSEVSDMVSSLVELCTYFKMVF